MQRIQNSTAVAVKPAYAPTGQIGYATGGDPGNGIPATIFDAGVFNNIQEEIMNVIEAAGLTPSAADDTQLLQAINNVMQGGYGTTTNTGNAYDVDTNIVFDDPGAGGRLLVIEFNANNTGPATLNPNDTADEDLLRPNGDPLEADDIVANTKYFVFWDGTDYFLIGGVGGTTIEFDGNNFFDGTGAQVDFTLGSTPVGPSYCLVWVDGVVQRPGSGVNGGAFTTSGNTLTFNEAPAVGTKNIQVVVMAQPGSAIVPANGSVTNAKMAAAAVGSSNLIHPVEFAKGSNIASAATTNIATATGNLVHITGNTTITSFGTAQAGAERTVVFDGALTLTHNATSLILPRGVNIITAAGDTAVFVSEGSGNWRCVSYTFANSGYLFVRDEKSNGTNGGSSSNATTHTRVLNTVVTNTISGASLGSNQITLPPGRYRIKARAPIAKGSGGASPHKAHLYNTTDAAVTIVGSNGWMDGGSPVGAQTDSFVSGEFAITAQKVFELRQYNTEAEANTGLGYAVSNGLVEVYAEVEIWKVA